MKLIGKTLRTFSAGVVLASTTLFGHAHAEDISLLNVSYDPTREFYQAYNKVFTEWYKEKTGDTVAVEQSHGGAGKQARSVIDGLPADVVTLALAYDISAIGEKTGKIPEDWEARLPNNSAPYSSTIVFLVRKGNPKNIHDWDDLLNNDVDVITPNPKTSGGARWNYLAAWSYVLKKELGDLSKLHDPAYADEVTTAENKAREFVTQLYKHVPILDSGARGSTTTFVKRGLGDVLLAWENEALLSVNKLGKGQFDIVVPSVSILAEPPVTLVNGNVEKKGQAATNAAKAYLEYLYSPIAQKLAAENYYRPVFEQFADPADLERFPDVTRVTVKDVFGSWQNAQKTHFNDGGVFDQIYLPQ